MVYRLHGGGGNESSSLASDPLSCQRMSLRGYFATHEVVDDVDAVHDRLEAYPTSAEDFVDHPRGASRRQCLLLTVVVKHQRIAA